MKNEKLVLLGLLQRVGFAASVRQITNGDKKLTIKQLQENAQKNLDGISDMCDFVLDKYSDTALSNASIEWDNFLDGKKGKIK